MNYGYITPSSLPPPLHPTLLWILHLLNLLSLLSSTFRLAPFPIPHSLCMLHFSFGINIQCQEKVVWKGLGSEQGSYLKVRGNLANVLIPSSERNVKSHQHNAKPQLLGAGTTLCKSECNLKRSHRYKIHGTHEKSLVLLPITTYAWPVVSTFLQIPPINPNIDLVRGRIDHIFWAE